MTDLEFKRATELEASGDDCYAGVSECYGPRADLRPCSTCREVRARGEALVAGGEL